MTTQQIEARIAWVQEQLASARHPQDLASLNRTLERLIMLDASDERDEIVAPA